jgi:hypothetical protein
MYEAGDEEASSFMAAAERNRPAGPRCRLYGSEIEAR